MEGLSDIKLYELICTMRRRNIHLLCIQETRKNKSDVFVSDHGYLVILSGSSNDSAEFAGVGFIISPVLRKALHGFKQISHRLALVKLRVRGGLMSCFCAYAPHGGLPYDVRQSFFNNLRDHFLSTSAHGVKAIFGDLNSRLVTSQPGEEQHFGPWCFGSANHLQVAGSNRSLLLELCVACNLAVANTFKENPVHKLVTYYEIGRNPFLPITPHDFAQLDLLLVPTSMLAKIRNVCSDMSAPLSSHHFLVEFTIDVDVDYLSQPPNKSVDLSLLRLPSIRRRFVQQFEGNMAVHPCGCPPSGFDSQCEKITSAFRSAEAEVLTTCPPRAKRSWISTGTLELIQRKLIARSQGRWAEEGLLAKQVKTSAKRDKQEWLDSLAASGNWSALRQLRRPSPPKQGRLTDLSGQLVSSECRAETLAEYLEKVQWAVRPTSLLDPGALSASTLNVNVGEVTIQEVARAVKSMKCGKACGPDDIPAEYWKAVLSENGESLQWLVKLCNKCWEMQDLPADWHSAIVAMLYKKGDPALCENYRPICLLCSGYKIFAQILLNRLKDAGAENALWPIQFGFRSNCGTNDALFVARRAMETAEAQRNGRLHVLALDWKKAFDSVSPDGLVAALRRFGVPPRFVDAVAGIYQRRVFQVRDGDKVSAKKPQAFGICQGCPLSPMLFSIVMTIVLIDARRALNPGAVDAIRTGDLSELLYADDTLLLGINSTHISDYICAIAEAGNSFGLRLHQGKSKLVTVGNAPDVECPIAGTIERKSSMVYLGGLLHESAHGSNELSRRLGIAAGEFKTLSRLWSHARVTRPQRLRYFSAFVLSKLQYGLSTLWLTQTDRQRVDGFQARCLRKILGIRCSFISRVSNAQVLALAGIPAVSVATLRLQLVTLGKLAHSDLHAPLRQAAFHSDLWIPTTAMFIRRVGRPRQTWAEQVWIQASKRCGGHARLRAMLDDSSPTGKVTWALFCSTVS